MTDTPGATPDNPKVKLPPGATLIKTPASTPAPVKPPGVQLPPGAKIAAAPAKPATPPNGGAGSAPIAPGGGSGIDITAIGKQNQRDYADATEAAGIDDWRDLQKVKKRFGRDYDWSGLDFLTQRDFYAADNDSERAKVLQKGQRAGKWQSFGKFNGTWYVMKNGVPFSVLGAGGTHTLDAANLAAHPIQTGMMLAAMFQPEIKAGDLAMAEGAPKILGYVAKNFGKGNALATGADAGSLGYVVKRLGFGTAYNIFRAGMVGLAGAAGAGADEVTKWARDLWDKSSDQERGVLTTSFLTGAAPELLFRAFGSTFNTIKNGYAPLMSKEERDRALDILNRGLMGRISQMVKPAKLAPFEQSMAEYIFGFPAEERNKAALKAEMLKKLKAVYGDDDKAKQALDRIMSSVHQRMDMSTEQDALRRTAQTRLGAETHHLETQLNAMNTNVKDQMAFLDRNIGSTDPEIQQKVQQALIDTRIKFGRDVGDVYKQVDALASAEGEPVVIDTSGIKKSARELLDELPRDEHGQLIYPKDKALSGVLTSVLRQPAFIEFSTAQGIRSELFRQGMYTDLTPGKDKVFKTALAKEVDAAFDQPGFGGANVKAAAKLREADALWRDGIQKFKGLKVKQLVKDAEQNRFADPETIADTVFDPKYSAEALRLRKMMPPEVWKGVGAAYWSKLKNSALNKLTGEFNAKKFAETLAEANDKGLLEAAFGRDQANAMVKVSREAAAVGGKLDADLLTPGNFKAQLEAYQMRKAQLDARLKSNYVQMLQDNSSERADAVKFMLDSPQRIREAKAFWGEGTPQWKSIQGMAMQHILSDGLGPDASLLKAVFKPGGLSGALRKYSTEELNDLLGATTAADLRELARTIDQVTVLPKAKATGAFAMASVVLHPLRHIRTILGLAAVGHLLTYPPFVRWLTQGMKTGTVKDLNAMGDLVKGAVNAISPGAVGDLRHDEQDTEQEIRFQMKQAAQ